MKGAEERPIGRLELRDGRSVEVLYVVEGHYLSHFRLVSRRCNERVSEKDVYGLETLMEEMSRLKEDQ